MNLADIVQGDWLKEFATATPATVATHEGANSPTVAPVATVAVANPPEDKTIVPDDPFLTRRDWLQRAGLNKDEAGVMAFKLERRDTEGDDRRLCLECRHLSGGAGSWRCSQWKQRQHNGPEIPGDLVTAILHRCKAFNDRLEAVA